MAIISSAEAATRFEIKQMVMKEAAHSSVPVPLAMAVAKVESDFNARALSSAGARGVMQIMPKTAQQEFGVHPEKLWNPEINIRLGVQFLERLYDQYDGRWDLVLSHYNGGTIKTGPPPQLYLAYVSKVQKWQQIYQEQANLWDVNDDVDLAQSETYSDYDDARLTEWRMREVEEWDNVAYQQPRHDDFLKMNPLMMTALAKPASLLWSAARTITDGAAPRRRHARFIADHRRAISVD